MTTLRLWLTAALGPMVARARPRARALTAWAAPGPVTMQERVEYWRHYFASRPGPSVDQRQQIEAERLRLAGMAAADEIARVIAAERIWMGPGREAGPLVSLEEWASHSGLGGEDRRLGEHEDRWRP